MKEMSSSEVQQGPASPPPPPHREGEAALRNDEADDDDDESEDEVMYRTDDEANAARQIGLSFYNQQKYGEALDVQYTIVRYFTGKYGLTNAICGLYYLDYGLSQLRLIQSRDSSSAAVAPLDQEGLETCFINLDTARVCFEKQEKQRPDDEEVQNQIAEVRNAIAQVHVEQENYDKALMEYENEVLIYRSLVINPQPRKLISAMYGMADCYMKECDFEEAEKRFQMVLDEIDKLPPDTTVEPELVQELQDLRNEASEMKSGKFKAVQELVRQQFLPEEQEDVPAPAEVLSQHSAPPPTAAASSTTQGAHASSSSSSASSNPFFSSLPGGDSSSLRSIPLALTSPMPSIAGGENSNSQSISHFLPQGNSRSQGGPIHQAPVVKKPKAAKAIPSLPAASEEPPLKKIRCE